jgi:hypothetical protein
MNKSLEITNEGIEYLMSTALEGGINYWANQCKIIENPSKKEYASEILAHGGILMICEDCGEKHFINKNTIIKGILKAIKHLNYSDFNKFVEDHDVEYADLVVQYAIFEKIVYA